MYPKRSIVYGTIMLTAVHLLLRLIGTSFQVYLSGKIGAEGIGLLQLTLSAGSFAMVAGLAGIRTATMYLSAEELGRKQPQNIPWVLSGCIRYSLITGGIAATVLFLLAPVIADKWVGHSEIIPSLRLFSGTLCVNCLCGVMTGYFTAEGRIGTLAAVEVAEQLFSMTVTILCLSLWAGTDPGRACESVILGSSAGACLTLLSLLILRKRERCVHGPKIRISGRLTAAAVPLALSDILRSGISTLENMMVPRRLALAPGVTSSLGAFGILSGMVFPILMFPACILHALADLLIPEIARCTAAGSTSRIRYLTGRCLGTALIYGLLFGGGMFLISEDLCWSLYKSETAGTVLKQYSLLIPMLYCDSLVDAMTKGAGQQKICVRYNIITSAMDVVGLYFLLPRLGMQGYFISFLITHLINFLLSLRRLLFITGMTLHWDRIGLCVFSALICVSISSAAPGAMVRIITFPLLLFTALWTFGIIDKHELHWFFQAFFPAKKTAS